MALAGKTAFLSGAEYRGMTSEIFAVPFEFNGSNCWVDGESARG